MPAKDILEKLRSAQTEAMEEIKRIDEQITQLQKERKQLLESLGDSAKGIKRLAVSTQSIIKNRQKKVKAQMITTSLLPPS